MLKSAALEEFGIPVRQANSRFWVVRASGGDYIPHFLQGQVAAIGHLDGLSSHAQAPSAITQAELENYLLATRSAERLQKQKISVANIKAQISVFIHEIKAGDTIVSMDSSRLAVGNVTGSAYFSSEKISVTHTDQTESHMGFKTRIPVQWMYQFKRNELPLVVKNSLQAHQTVFSLERHWTYIYHLIFPMFADSKHLYLSNYIHQKEDVSSYAMSHLLSFYSDLEPLLFGNTEDQLKAFEAYRFDELTDLFAKQLSKRYLSFKTEVFSEGPVWWKLPLEAVGNHKRVAVLVTLLIALFGGELGPIKMPGVVTPEMRKELLDFILKRIEENKMEEAKRQLLLDIPRQFTNPIQPPKQVSQQKIQT